MFKIRLAELAKAIGVLAGGAWCPFSSEGCSPPQGCSALSSEKNTNLERT